MSSSWSYNGEFEDTVEVEGKKYYPYAEFYVEGYYEFSPEETDCPADFRYDVNYVEIESLYVQDENDDEVTDKELLEKIKKEVESYVEGGDYADEIDVYND